MATRTASTAPKSTRQATYCWVLLALLGGTLLVLFHNSLTAYQILFANDAPLGFLKAECNRLPERFAGTWRALSWLGGAAPSPAPTLSYLLLTVVSPEVYLKIYAPLTLLFVGFCAWVFFRQLRFHPVVCILGAVAAGLNAHCFSVACWGLGAWNIAIGMVFLALAALSAKSIKQTWAKAVLAGLAVGMGLMEGFDVGAILSVLVGVFVVFRALIEEAPTGQKVGRAILSEALVILFAGFIAVHTISMLIETQVQGVAMMEQDQATKEQRWKSATQWSMPKVESLEILVPGLFGYRMLGNITDSDRSSAYWGEIGQDSRIPILQGSDLKLGQQTATNMNATPELVYAMASDDPPTPKDAITTIVKKSGAYWRYRGTGEFAGTLVSLLALFALANLWRANTPLSKSERLAVGFWGVAAVFSLLAACGRFGFLYHLLYQLPYFSTIRNPIKFLHPFHVAWVILAAYGMEALCRRLLSGRPKPVDPQAKVFGFEKKWAAFSLLLVAASVVGFLLLNFKYKHHWIDYLEAQTFTPAMALSIVNFSLGQIVWFIVCLILSAGLLIAMLSGFRADSAGRTAWIFMGALLIVDLARADAPWIRYYDYGEKYSLNPIVDFLQDKPYEHRVIGKLEPKGPGSGLQPGFGELYFFWLQNDFPYHNIQSLDFAQMPRTPELDRNYFNAFQLKGTDIRTTDLWPAIRLWQLTNTRYILIMASGAEMLNSRLDPAHRSFRDRIFFDMHRKADALAATDFGDYTVDTGTKGAYAVVEYGDALPRAKLYSNWTTPTNDDAALQMLTSHDFDPTQSVVLSPETPAPAPSSPAADPGAVSITQYRPKLVQLQAKVKTPAILLLNDHFAPNWNLWVDNKPAPILRCNYLMRGVYLAPGSHTVDFRFQPSLKTLYVTLSAYVAGFALAGYLLATRSAPDAASAPRPAPSPAPPSPVNPPPQAPPANSSPGRKKGNGGNQTKPPRKA